MASPRQLHPPGGTAHIPALSTCGKTSSGGVDGQANAWLRAQAQAAQHTSCHPRASKACTALRQGPKSGVEISQGRLPPGQRHLSSAHLCFAAYCVFLAPVHASSMDTATVLPGAARLPPPCCAPAGWRPPHTCSQLGDVTMLLHSRDPNSVAYGRACQLRRSRLSQRNSQGTPTAWSARANATARSAAGTAQGVSLAQE